MSLKSFVLTAFSIISMSMAILSLADTMAGLKVVEIQSIPGKMLSKVSYMQDESSIVGRKASIPENVEIIVANESGGNLVYIWSQAGDNSQTAGMVALVEQELGEYTNNFISSIGLKRIFIVDDIINKSRQPVLGFADPMIGDIYLNSVETEGYNSRRIVAEQTLHHEIAHLLAYSNYGYEFETKSDWSSLDSNFSDLSEMNVDSEYFPVDGYVSRYSLTSSGEDFAETYSMFYTEVFAEDFDREIDSSTLLKEKAIFVLTQISRADRDQCQMVSVFSDLNCR